MIANTPSRLSVVMAAGALLFGGAVLTGCKTDSQYSQKELAEFKQGPPKQMPPEAMQVMQNANRARSSAAGQPTQAGTPR
jgi:hypothetical protein